jgi:hypothetical protein
MSTDARWKDVRRSRSGRRRSRKRRRAAARAPLVADRPTQKLKAEQFCTRAATRAAAAEERALELAEEEALARAAPAPTPRKVKPPKRTKRDIAQFVRQKLEALEKKQHGLKALECRITELERERAALVGRHTIHQKATLQDTIDELRQEARTLETQEELVDFRRGCREFLRTYAALEAQERAAEAVGVPKLSDIRVGEKRKINTTRRRRVAKPELRLISGGELSAVVAADAFLEQYDGASKPLCLQSDEQCSLCGGALVLDVQADVMVCEVCRNEQMAMLSSHRQAGYAAVEHINLSASRYRRIVHMISHLQRFEGCVGSEKITDGLIATVMRWLHAQGITEERVTKAKVEKALRKTGHSDMVVYKTVITGLITNKTPPRFTPDQRAQLIFMFNDISNAFQKILDRGEFPSRLNFLSYQFVLCKQLGLLEWGQPFQAHFRLLKGKENLSRQDMFWKAICKEVGLRFISSV